MDFKKKSLLFLLISFLAFSFACEKSSEFLKIRKKSKKIIRKIKIEDNQSQIHVPRLILNLTSDKYIEYVKTNYPKAQFKDEELIVNIPRSFLKLKVILKEKKKGALINDYILYLPEGGGVIDLADYSTGKKGSFYVQFEFYKKNKKNKNVLNNFLLFYSSHTKKTSFGGSSIGTHCGTFLNLTSFGKKFLLKEGILIKVKNEKDSEPIQFIGGIFYFIYFKHKHLYLGVVQFKDSRFSHLQC